MEKELNNKCRICESVNIADFKIGSTDFIKCKECDIHYLAVFADSDKTEEYYKNDYIITKDDIIDTEFRHLFRLTEQMELISEISNYVPAPAKLLDVGCDKAYFIDEARRFGYDCTGVELSEAAVVYAKNLGFDIKPAPDSSAGKYDCAVMWHSLEHFQEPVEFLKELRKHLNACGHLFIRVPAFDTFWRRFLGSKWIWLQPQNHFFHYSASSLGKLLEVSGYSIEKIVHRKPNNRHTKRMYKTASSFFSSNFDRRQGLRNRLKRKYEDLTGIELFAVARIKANE